MSSSERDQISKGAAEASNVALAGAALRSVVLPHFTELVTLPVFAGDAPGCSQIMNDHKKGFPCLLVCAFVLVLLRSVTFIVGGKTPPLKHTKPAQRYMQFSFYQTL